MPDPKEGPSMIMRRAGGEELASREIALSLASMIIERVYGEGELAAQLPIQVTELPGSWLVEGSKDYDYSNPEEDYLVLGRITLEIAKANCQVLQFSRYADFALQQPSLVDPDDQPSGDPR